MKVMVACSAGGHWVQMRRILPAFDGLDRFYVGVEATARTPRSGRCATIRSPTSPGRTRSAWLGVFAELRRIVARRAARRSRSPPGRGRGSWRSRVGQARRRQPHVWIELDRQHRADVALGPAGAAGRRRAAGAVGAPRPARRPGVLGGGAVIFVTIGSMFPFDRLIRAMDAWAAAQPERRVELLAQIGDGGYEPAAHALGAQPRPRRTTPGRWPGRARRRPCRHGLGDHRGRARQADRAAAAARRARRAYQRPPGRHRPLAAHPPRASMSPTPRATSPAAHRRGAAPTGGAAGPARHHRAPGLPRPDPRASREGKAAWASP